MQMINKLRRRLILVSMLSLLLVLGSIVTAANLINWRQITQDADSILDVLAENEGFFPELREDFGGGPWDGETAPARPEGESAATMPEGETTENRPVNNREKWRNDLRGRGLSQETPFESRFFSVKYNEDGSVDDVEITRIASVSEEDAISYAEEILAKGRARGFYGSYRYLVCNESADSEDSAGQRVILLDRQNQLATLKHFVLASYGLSALGLLLVLILITLLSGRIIRPFVDNYEKQRRFITDAGHELKTPLAIIEADSEVLEMDLGEDNEWLSDIRKQTRRLAELTANLIFLARSEESTGTAQRIDFPLSDVVEESAESYRGPALAGGQSFEMTVEPMLSLCGDEKQIRQLVGILMDNALKYTPAGGDIRLTLKKDGKWLRLSVCNTAENIKKEQLPHLFDRFYRTDASRNSATGGYGIGLSIAQAIVAGHKGQIKATTADECSLTITASFPAG